jgi:peptidoglycan/LPS O-acetylase OafA/YrhL
MATSSKLAFVDALRGLAILAVAAVHCGQYGSNNYPAPVVHAISKGAMGVQLFYVMSAFTLFLSHRGRQGKEEHPDRNFFIRRLFRIAPMYWLGIVYYLWQNGTGPNTWTGSDGGITIGNIAANVLFLHGLHPNWFNSLVPGGWSIGVEMLFYCTIPWLCKKVVDLHRALLFLLISLVVAFALHVGLLLWHPLADDWLWREFLFYYLPNQLPVFALGIILFHLLYGDAEEPKAWVVLALGASLLVRLLSGTGVLFPDHVLFGCAFLAAAWALARWPTRAIVNPVISHIGKVSFSMYLVHFAVLHGMQHFGLVDFLEVQGTASALLNFVLRYALVVAASVAVSTALYHALEVPMQQLGKRLIKRLEPAR